MIPPLEIVWASDTGRVRQHNEDSVAGDAELGAVVLADGMGGYQAGEIASDIATKNILQHLRVHWNDRDLNEFDSQAGCRQAGVLLRNAVLAANHAIFHSAQSDTELHGMGTTVVAAVFYDQHITVAHVGDSRLYRLRHGELAQLTRDHSVLQELIEQGFFTPEEARHSPNKNLVTRALGVSPEVSVDIGETLQDPEDIYLLCSDGLNDMLEDRIIGLILHQYQDDLAAAAQALVDAANSEGGEDNISVLLARASRPASARKSWWRRLKARFLR